MLKPMLKSLCFLLLFLPSLCQAGTLSSLGSERWVTVSKVYDGDTFKTRHGEKIRVLSLNTPETRHGAEVGQVGGNAAKKALKQLILGKVVRLRFDKEKKDRYGRTLAQVWMRDGLWVNAWLLNQGYAHIYTFEPNIRWTKQLLKEEQYARQRGLGIWSMPRFKILNAKYVSGKYIGQFRVVQGSVGKALNKKAWRFTLGKLTVSVPKAYRKYFKHPISLKKGQKLTIRGKIRISSKGKLFLALHSPLDLES